MLGGFGCKVEGGDGSLNSGSSTTIFLGLFGLLQVQLGSLSDRFYLSVKFLDMGCYDL